MYLFVDRWIIVLNNKLIVKHFVSSSSSFCWCFLFIAWADVVMHRLTRTFPIKNLKFVRYSFFSPFKCTQANVCDINWYWDAAALPMFARTSLDVCFYEFEIFRCGKPKEISHLFTFFIMKIILTFTLKTTKQQILIKNMFLHTTKLILMVTRTHEPSMTSCHRHTHLPPSATTAEAW
jgi:hypothetical protein